MMSEHRPRRQKHHLFVSFESQRPWKAVDPAILAQVSVGE